MTAAGRLPWVLDLDTETGAVFVRKRGREVRDCTEPLCDFATRPEAEDIRRTVCGEPGALNFYYLPKLVTVAEARAMFARAMKRRRRIAA